MTDHEAERGLRARKRAATRAAIEHAAITLAQQQGYDRVTVDMICEASMVSPRTFFNYFGSKEVVILGGIPDLPSAVDIDAFVHGASGNLLEDFLVLISRSMTDHAHAHDHELLRARRSVIQRTPELALKEQIRITEHEARYREIIMDRFHVEGRTPPPGFTLEDEARMTITLSTAVIQHMAAKWPLALPDPDQATQIIRDAGQLIRRLVVSSE